jgi:hypothetical protein
MNAKLYAPICVGLIAGSLGFASSAQAFSFTTHYDEALSTNPSQGDIWLEAVEFDGKTVSNFSFVDRVDIIHNDLWTGGNSGAGSADKGDQATVGLSEERLTNDGARTALRNTNLNSIIDGEDRGEFSMNLWFDNAVDNLFFWERGRNSAMTIQAIDTAGDILGDSLTINSRNWDNAGFRLDTIEIGGSQRVGSLGVSLADLGLSSAIQGVRVSAEGTSFYNGPDWKVVGEKVPEPGTVVGLGSIAMALVASRRRRSSAS